VQRPLKSLNGNANFHRCIVSLCLKCLQHALNQQHLTKVNAKIRLAPFSQAQLNAIDPI
jgi:hypothetical protein